MTAWELRQKALLAQYAKNKGVFTFEEKTALEGDLQALEKEKPEEPEFPNITFSEPTAAAIWRHYQYGRPSAGLFSDEGITFFGGHGMRDESKGLTIGDICKLWDGSPLIRTRAGDGESGVMTDRRLSAHLMMQPIVAQKVLSDPLLSNQGFLARFLVCQIESVAGTRFLANRDSNKGIEDEVAYQNYIQRMTDLLNKPLSIDEGSGSLILNKWNITGEVFAHWSKLHDKIEQNLISTGQFYDIKAVASKAAENAARIAGVMAYYEGTQSIECNHIERAGQLIYWYLESMAAHTRTAQYDTEALEATELLAWIIEHNGQLNAEQFKNLPSAFRSATKARKLLGLLVIMGHLQVTTINTKNKPSGWLAMNA